MYIGVFVNYLLFSATTPLVNIFFIQKVSTTTFSIVNWVSIVLTLIMSRILKDKINRDILEKFFLMIIILDTVVFLLISIVGEYYINVRFFGVAILNGTTTAIWMCVMRSNINKVIIGEELTDFQTHQNYLISVAELIGATIAIVLTKIDIGIEMLMFVQIVASVTMGFFDYKTINIIKYKLEYKEVEEANSNG